LLLFLIVFCQLFDDLFYTISKLGDKSHSTLINRSKNYVNNYIDPLQLEVDNLTEEVIRLTEQLNETNEENPFYPNGTLIAKTKDDGTPQAHNIYYMDRGLARKLAGMYNGDVFIALKASLGYPASTPYSDIVLAVPQTIIDGLEKGPKLDIEDIAYPGAKNEERRLEENIVQQNQISIDNITSNSWWGTYINSGIGQLNRQKLINEGQPIIINSIKSAWRQEKQIETLRNEYLSDIKYGYTDEERTNGQILLDQLLQPYNKLNAARDTIVRYRRMWLIMFSPESPNLITDIKTAVSNPVSNTERSEFEGKWSDDNFIEFFPTINIDNDELSLNINPDLPGPSNMGQGQ
jgi:hypothetical protein